MSRKIDSLIAEHVFGLELSDNGYFKYYGYPNKNFENPSDWGNREIPTYSTDISSAWFVVDELSEEFEFRLWGPHRRMKDEDWDKWECEFTNITTKAWYSERSESATMAICLASLKALGVEI